MNKVQSAVKFLNDKLLCECAAFESDYFSYLEYTETPVGDSITYMGHCLWNSENCSNFDEEGDNTVEYFIYQEVLKILKVVRETAITLSLHE